MYSISLEMISVIFLPDHYGGWYIPSDRANAFKTCPPHKIVHDIGLKVSTVLCIQNRTIVVDRDFQHP